MSRIGQEPIIVPDDVRIKIDDGLIEVEGKLGNLGYKLPEGISVEFIDGRIKLSRKDNNRRHRALHGLARTLVANMVYGVINGFTKELEIVGVGYRCDMLGKAIQLSVGYSHKVVFIPPEGIEIKVTEPTRFAVNGINKEIVGDVAAKIRSIRPPEPYKGKGIRYIGERVRRKAGKTAGK